MKWKFPWNRKRSYKQLLKENQELLLEISEAYGEVANLATELNRRDIAEEFWKKSDDFSLKYAMSILFDS